MADQLLGEEVVELPGGHGVAELVGREDRGGRVPAGRVDAGLDDQDLLDPALLAEGAVVVGDDLGAQVHHDVDRGGQLADRQLAGDLRSLLHRAGDELLDGVLGAAGVGGADRTRAGLHRLEHVPDLRAADLADDLAGEVEPEGVVDGLLEAELTGLAAVDADLAGSGAVLPGVDDLVPVDQLVQVQLELGLEGADHLPGRDARAQGADPGGLAGALDAGDDDALAGSHAGGEEVGQDRGAGLAVVDHLVHGDLAHAVAADHDRGVGHHPGAGSEPRSPGQPQVQVRTGLGEGPVLPRAEVGEELAQLVLGVGDRVGLDQGAVDQFEPHRDHRAASDDDDVLHVRTLDQRLQPAQAEQRGLEGGLECLLLVLGPRRAAGGDERLGLGLDELLDHVEAHLLAVLLGDAAACLVEPGSQARGDLGAVLRDQLPVQFDVAGRGPVVVGLLRCGRDERAQAELGASPPR